MPVTTGIVGCCARAAAGHAAALPSPAMNCRRRIRDLPRWIRVAIQRVGKAFPAQQTYALCRCGQSKTKPFCDGSHVHVAFDGTETVDRTPYSEQVTVLGGPGMVLTDAEKLCAFGRFCDPNGKVWSQVSSSDDPDVRATFIRQVGDCPAGRLVAWDKATGKAIEPEFPVSIGLVEDL